MNWTVHSNCWITISLFSVVISKYLGLSLQDYIWRIHIQNASSFLDFFPPPPYLQSFIKCNQNSRNNQNCDHTHRYITDDKKKHSLYTNIFFLNPSLLMHLFFQQWIFITNINYSAVKISVQNLPISG